MKKALAVIGGVVGVLLLGFIILVIVTPAEEEGAKLVKTSSSSNETVNSEVETADVKNEDLSAKVFKIGDTVEYEGLQVTITSAKFTEPEEYSESENGKILTLEVEAFNNSDEELVVDETEFNIYDMEGNVQDSYFGYDESPIAVSFNKGKKASGKLFFDVTEDTQYELIYTPTFSFLESEDITFIIEVE